MSSEEAVGITEYTTAGTGFRAVTKQRFSDFIVHEIELGGRKVELKAMARPATVATAAEKELAAEEAATALTAAIGQELATAVLAMVQASASRPGAGADAPDVPTEVSLPRDDDKDRRREVHQLVKRFPTLSSDTVDTADGGKAVRIVSKREAQRAAREDYQQSGGKGGGKGGGGKRRKLDNRSEWPAEAKGCKYLSFTLYKENRDTLDALQQLARALYLGPNSFGFAGTKDRRAVTSQRVTAYKLTAQRLEQFMGRRPFGDSIVVGDLGYVPEGLRLGQHGGNRFTITLRDVDCSEEQLVPALKELDRRGFINYFGLQRFGSNADAATHHVGAALLAADWSKVLTLLLGTRVGEREDEAAARKVWVDTGDAAAVLQVLPRRMGTERALLEGLQQHGSSNILAALSKVPRGLKKMYLHAFQSYLWNHAASERARRYGVDAVVAGDLVDLSDTRSGAAGLSAQAAEGLACGGDGAAVGQEELDEEAWGSGTEPHVVTEDEAARGVYGVDQVVLPMPGYRVKLPENAVAESYTALLSQHSLSLPALDHRVREFALPGAYRRFVTRPAQLEWRYRRYDDPTLPLVATDLQRLRGEPEPAGTPDGRWAALILEFTLPPSSYATMCLRELTKQGTDLAHQQELNRRSLGEGAAETADARPQPSEEGGACSDAPVEGHPTG